MQWAFITCIFYIDKPECSWHIFCPTFSVVKSPIFDTLSTAKRKKNYCSFIIIMSDNLWSSSLFIIFGFKKWWLRCGILCFILIFLRIYSRSLLYTYGNHFQFVIFQFYTFFKTHTTQCYIRQDEIMSCRNNVNFITIWITPQSEVL